MNVLDRLQKSGLMEVTQNIQHALSNKYYDGKSYPTAKHPNIESYRKAQYEENVAHLAHMKEIREFAEAAIYKCNTREVNRVTGRGRDVNWDFCFAQLVEACNRKQYCKFDHFTKVELERLWEHLCQKGLIGRGTKRPLSDEEMSSHSFRGHGGLRRRIDEEGNQGTSADIPEDFRWGSAAASSSAGGDTRCGSSRQAAEPQRSSGAQNSTDSQDPWQDWRPTTQREDEQASAQHARGWQPSSYAQGWQSSSSHQDRGSQSSWQGWNQSDSSAPTQDWTEPTQPSWWSSASTSWSRTK